LTRFSVNEPNHSRILLRKNLFKVANIEAHVILKDLKNAKPVSFLYMFSHVLVVSNECCNFSKTLSIVLKCNTDNNQKCIEMVGEALRMFKQSFILQFARLDLLKIIINDKKALSRTFSEQEKRIFKSMPIPQVPCQARKK